MHRQAFVEKTREIRFTLGLLYHHGIGVEADPARAAHWYRLADAEGYDFPLLGREAQKGLAAIQILQAKLPPPAKGLTARESRAGADGPEAMLRLATLYLQGLCAPLDWEKSRDWEIRAAEAGDPEAIGIATMNYQHGLFAYPRDQSAAFPPPDPLAVPRQTPRQASEKAKPSDGKPPPGPRKASDMAYDLYIEGKESEERGDYYEAGLRFCEAAAFGVAAADNYRRLGRIQELGLCGDPNPYGAGMSYRIAAELGNPESMFLLGRLHEKGLGVRGSTAEALKWYAAARDAGVAEAGEALAALSADRENAGPAFRDGWRLSPVFRTVLADAQFRASYNYTRFEFPKEMRTAAGFLGRAAEAGQAQAQYRLGLFRLEGNAAFAIGVDRDEARRWLGKSAASGYEPAKAALEDMENTTDPPMPR